MSTMSGFSSNQISVSQSSLSSASDTSYSKMEEELTCPVCLELFADPLMLSCSHSLCKKCLEDILKSRSKTGKEGIECPSCRKKLLVDKEMIAKLPRNLALENVVFRFQEMQSTTLSNRKSLDLSLELPLSSPSSKSELESPVFIDDVNEMCSLCEGNLSNKATWFCEQCNVLYCDQCLDKYHPRKGALCHHKIRKPTQLENTNKSAFCSDHKTEQAAVFCDQCKLLVCHLCVCDDVGKHSGHKILAHDTACNQLKSELLENKKKLCSTTATVSEQNRKIEEMYEEIEDIHSQACQKIESQYRRLVEDTTSALRQQKQTLLSNMATLKSKSLNKLRKKIDGYSQLSKEMEDLLESCKKILDEDHTKGLLSRAAEVQPISDKVTEIENSVSQANSDFCDLTRSSNVQQDLKRSMAKFRNSSLSCLQLMASDDAEKCQSIVPILMSPTSPGKDVPRVQNKCLITWGFNSTSFTAEKLTSNGLWSVTVEKNTSHLGDIKNGYLFGVGIASEALNFKDSVGMNSKSFGIVCTGGNLVFCHDSKVEHLMPLDGLPLSVTVCILTDQSCGVVFSYTITSATWGDTLCGKKVLVDSSLKKQTFPVFTVSQRVKMQFPTHV